jgi:hypothetical protein
VALVAIPPYNVSFLPEQPPTKIGNSYQNPGPDNGKQRAGYTKFMLDAKLTVSSVGTAPGTDPKIPFFFESITVEFSLKDFSIEISSDYKPGSCPYKVTCEHEMESHVTRPTQLFLDYRDVVVGKLNQIPLPTKPSPRKILRGQEDATEALLTHPLFEAIKALKADLKAILDKDRLEQDAPDAYRKIYARCRKEEWGVRQP